jgi:phospholipase/carboxylesterase
MDIHYYSQPLLIESDQPVCSIIAFHGLGSNGYELKSAMKIVHRHMQSAVSIILPTAPMIPMTILNGAKANSWFDMMSIEPVVIDRKGVFLSEHCVLQFIEKEVKKNIPYHRIFLFGFSQGASLVLHVGMRLGMRLGGVIGASGFLPIKHYEKMSFEDFNTPFLITHGSNDTMVPFFLARETNMLLASKKFKSDFYENDDGHFLNEEMLKKIANWIDHHIMSLKCMS